MCWVNKESFGHIDKGRFDQICLAIKQLFPQSCFRYLLTARCKYENRCHFRHEVPDGIEEVLATLGFTGARFED